MDRRKLRGLRVRKKVKGTPERPRLSVFVSNRQMYAQLIDDTVGRTLYALSTMDKEMMKETSGKPMKEKAELLGKKFGEGALARDIKQVVFDRSGYKYGMRLGKLADAVRGAGVNF